MTGLILTYLITTLGSCIICVSCLCEDSCDIKQFIKKCSELFNANVICTTRYMDLTGSYIVACVMHVIFVWLAIFYWGYILWHAKKGS